MITKSYTNQELETLLEQTDTDVERSLVDECLYLDLTKKGNNHGNRLEAWLVLSSEGLLRLQKRGEHRGDIMDNQGREIEVKFCIHTNSAFAWKHLRPCRKNVDDLLFDCGITRTKDLTVCAVRWFYLKWKTFDDYIEHEYNANTPKDPTWTDDDLVN
jgi:hypothetical protein